eukprot:PhM_4_TR2710/c0_g1_i1/m.37510
MNDTSSSAPGSSQGSSVLRVALRVRPFEEKPSASPASQYLNFPGPNVVTHHSIDVNRSFTFDKVYRAESQALIFHDIGAGLVKDVLDAVNVCVITYGQSCTGKTYTMLGADDDDDRRGLVPRFCESLYKAVHHKTDDDDDDDVENLIAVSAVYIFNEKVYDALPGTAGLTRRSTSVRRSSSSSGAGGGTPPTLRTTTSSSSRDLRVREHPDKGPYVEGLREHVVTSAADMWKAYKACDAARPSQLAHTIFIIKYSQKIKGKVPADPTTVPISSTNANFITRRHSMGPELESIIKQRNSKNNSTPVKPPPPHPPRREVATPSASKTHRSGSLLNFSPHAKKGSEDLVHRALSTPPPSATELIISQRTASVTLCDLASADRSSYENKITLKKPEERQHAGKLNQSLSCLTRVIGVLAAEKTKRGLLPFRDSVLTWILKDKLGGNCKTLLFATISANPEDNDSTLSTLLFSERARCIRTHYQPNVQNESPVVAILRELTDVYTELQRQRVEIRRILAPSHDDVGGIGSHMSAVRGLSLSADVAFFGGSLPTLSYQSMMVLDNSGQSVDIRTLPRHELQLMSRSVEDKLAQNRAAITDIVKPLLPRRISGFLSSRPTSLVFDGTIPDEVNATPPRTSPIGDGEDPSLEDGTSFRRVLHQLGVFRLEVLKEVLPEEYTQVATTSRKQMQMRQDEELLKSVVAATAKTVTMGVIEGADDPISEQVGSNEKDGCGRDGTDSEEAASISSDCIQEGEDELQYRLRMLRRRQDRHWAQILRAGDTSEQSCAAKREEYLKRNSVMSRLLSKGPNRTMHICRQDFEEWDLEYIDSNIGVTGVEFIQRRHTSLARAVLFADNGDIIEVHPGVWREPITILRDVTLRGVGPREKIVLKSSDEQPALTLQSADGHISNLTIQQHGGDCAVLIRGGCAVLSNCSISAFRAKCGVHVTGYDTNPRLDDNYIHDCSIRGCGVLIDGGAHGMLEKNHITRNGSAGVIVEGDKSHPHLLKNRVIAGKGAGIAFGDGAGGVVEDNLIENNGCSGVLVESGSNPTICRNQIMRNLGGGVVLSGEKTLGLVIENTITDNLERDVYVLRGAAPQLRQNKLIGGTRHGVSAPFGVVVASTAQCLATLNEIDGYEGNGVGVRGDDSACYAVGNVFRVRHQGAGGVCISDRGTVQLRYNSFWFYGNASDSKNPAARLLSNGTNRPFPVKGNKVGQDTREAMERDPEAFSVPWKFELANIDSTCIFDD